MVLLWDEQISKVGRNNAKTEAQRICPHQFIWEHVFGIDTKQGSTAGSLRVAAKHTDLCAEADGVLLSQWSRSNTSEFYNVTVFQRHSKSPKEEQE